VLGQHDFCAAPSVLMKQHTKWRCLHEVVAPYAVAVSALAAQQPPVARAMSWAFQFNFNRREVGKAERPVSCTNRPL
jgi:hypothetical protein